MLYLSELKNKKVVEENGSPFGSLDDLIFQATDNPLITKLVIKNNTKSLKIIPIKYLKSVNSVITIYKDHQTASLGENELYATKNLLDKQIIDIKGDKIVRVNDVAIQNGTGKLRISGVDIGWLGLLRWFRIEDVVFKMNSLFHVKSASSRFLSWGEIQPLELARGQVILKNEETKLKKIKPEDLADYLERTTIDNVRKFITILDEQQAAEVINSLNITYQTGLFRHFTPEQSAKILSLLEPDEAVDIFLTFSLKKQAHIFELFTPEKKEEIQYLLGLSKTPIGNIVTTEYITVSPEQDANSVTKLVRSKTTGFAFLNYVYVVNHENALVGVFNLHELLLQNKETPVYKFMVQDVEVIHLTTPVEIAVKKMIKYAIHALPVIDKDKNLLGIVCFNDLASFIGPKV